MIVLSIISTYNTISIPQDMDWYSFTINTSCTVKSTGSLKKLVKQVS